MNGPSKIPATGAQLEMLRHARALAAELAAHDLTASIDQLLARCTPRPFSNGTLRCMVCGEVFDTARIAQEQAERCPACQTTALPCYPDRDVFLAINWQELRVLAQWSSNFAESLHDDARSLLGRILTRINLVRPEGAPALTALMEFKELQKQIPNATFVDAAGNVIVPPKAGGAS